MSEAKRRRREMDDVEARRVIDRLSRAKQDLQGRIAERMRALDGTGRPISDPLYQRLVLVLDGLEARRRVAERELSERGVDIANSDR